MKEGHMRGVRPEFDDGLLSEHPKHWPIDVQVLSHEPSGAEILCVRVNPKQNDWWETPIGRLRVGPVFPEDVEAGEVKRVRLFFEKGSELRQKCNKTRRLKEQGFREVDIDDSGYGWQELRRDKPYRRGKFSSKWLHVIVDSF